MGLRFILDALKSISNPWQAIDKILSSNNVLPTEVSDMLKTGLQRKEDPMNILKDAASQGTINLDHFNSVKNMFLMAKRFGIKQFKSVNAQDLNIIEQTIRNSSNRGGNSNIKPNGGFRRL